MHNIGILFRFHRQQRKKILWQILHSTTHTWLTCMCIELICINLPSLCEEHNAHHFPLIHVHIVSSRSAVSLRWSIFLFSKGITFSHCKQQLCNDRNCWRDVPLWVRLANSWSVDVCQLLWHLKCAFVMFVLCFFGFYLAEQQGECRCLIT